MALPELLANSPTPGSRLALTTLSEALSEAGLSMKWNAAPPAALHGTGQFRVTIDSEIILCEAGESATVKILERGAEGSTKAAHSSGASVWGLMTAGATKAFVEGRIAYTASIEAAEPAEYWPMQEKSGTTFANKAPTGTAGNMTPMAGGGVITAGTSGPWGGELAAEFDGLSRLQTAGVGTLSEVTNALSMEAWVYVPSAALSHGHITKAGAVTSGYGVAKGGVTLPWAGTAGTQLIALIEAIEWIAPNVTATTFFSKGWHHVGVIWGEKSGENLVQVLFLLDGIVVFAGTTHKAASQLKDFIMIGARASSTAISGNLEEPWTGKICHVAYYKREVSPSLFTQHAGYRK